MSQWHPQILDKYVAPGISTFTEANIPDLSGRFPQAEFWTRNYFLNRIFRGEYPEKMRQLVMGYLRRAQLVHSAYHEARRLTLEFLDGKDPHAPRVGRYYDAVARWEQFAIEASITLDIFKYIFGQGAFTKDDGSKEQRLYHIANKVKHVGNDIAVMGVYAATDMVPLWLTDAGLNSVGTLVTYDEAAGFVIDAAKVAEDLQDPVTFTEKIRAAAAASQPAPAGQAPPASPGP